MENVIEIDKSPENTWRKVEESKSNMASVYEEIEALKEEINGSREKLAHQRQRNIQLGQYSRRENIRLVNVKEEEEGENTAKLFIEALKDMNLYNEKMRFHAIHRVPSNDETNSSAGGRPCARGSPRHIIARFVCREDRNFIWKNCDKITELPKFDKAFFVPDLAKELEAENYILRGAARRAKVKKIRVAIRRIKLVMLDSGLNYSANEVPQYLRR